MGKTFYKRGSNADRSTEDEITDALIRCSLEIQERVRRGMGIGVEDTPSAQNFHATMSPTQSLEFFSRRDVLHSDEMIFSQDSFAPSVLARTSASQQYMQNLSRVSTATHTQGSNSSHPFEHLLNIELLREDVIVEKMHIHYGLKSENPVSRLRFFQKGGASSGEPQIARKLKESQYETVLPRVFEELAIRVFCRDPRKTKLLMKAFEKWCRDQLFPSPVLALSQTTDL